MCPSWSENSANHNTEHQWWVLKKLNPIKFLQTIQPFLQYNIFQTSMGGVAVM
jgi:hypothetical protein